MQMKNYWIICFLMASGLIIFEHFVSGIGLYLVGCTLATNREEVKEIGNW